MISFFSNLYSFRFLTSMLITRDLKLRYKHTTLGLIWVVLQPLLPLIIFFCVFGKMMKINSFNVPYLIFAFSGIVLWTFFSETVNRCTNCLVAEEGLLTKVYFPKIILPFSRFVAVGVDFLISLAMFIVFLLIYKIHFSSRFLFFPVVLLVLFMFSFGIGVFLSALNVYFRDFRIIVPFLLQIGMYASPVIYSLALVPEKYRLVFSLNPLVGIIESFRWVCFEQIQIFPFFAFIISILFSIIVLTTSFVFFKKVELFFADII